MSKPDDITRIKHMLDPTQKVLIFTRNRSREAPVDKLA